MVVVMTRLTLKQDLTKNRVDAPHQPFHLRRGYLSPVVTLNLMNIPCRKVIKSLNRLIVIFVMLPSPIYSLNLFLRSPPLSLSFTLHLFLYIGIQVQVKWELCVKQRANTFLDMKMSCSARGSYNSLVCSFLTFHLESSRLQMYYIPLLHFTTFCMIVATCIL